MAIEKRKNSRFSEMGRVYSPDLCVFPGMLLDISLGGCRVRFPAVVEPDADMDYEITIGLFKKTAAPLLVLIGHPQWTSYNQGSTEIGFQILHSPGTRDLTAYIERLSGSDNQNDEEIESFEEMTYA